MGTEIKSLKIKGLRFWRLNIVQVPGDSWDTRRGRQGHFDAGFRGLVAGAGYDRCRKQGKGAGEMEFSFHTGARRRAG